MGTKRAINRNQYLPFAWMCYFRPYGMSSPGSIRHKNRFRDTQRIDPPVAWRMKTSFFLSFSWIQPHSYTIRTKSRLACAGNFRETGTCFSREPSAVFPSCRGLCLCQSVCPVRSDTYWNLTSIGSKGTRLDSEREKNMVLLIASCRSHTHAHKHTYINFLFIMD